MSFLISILFNFFTLSKSVDTMYCDIKGNVKNPGVYEVIDGEVINDIIEKAGGLKKNSYVKNINLSKKVSDEMVINILSIHEYENLTYECPVCVCEEIKCENKITTTKNEIETSTYNIETTKYLTTTTKNNILTTTKSITTTINTTTKLVELININSATLDELMTLPGIGKTIANRIVEYRINNLFINIEDIKNVKGIGDGLFENIKEFITV